MNYCKDCALRLYNTKTHNLSGIGNCWNNRCIVVPNVDYQAYKGKSMSFSVQVDKIKDILLLSTGELLSNLYIVPLIRCNETISCEINDKIYNNCLHYFAEDVKKYQFKDILLLGSAARRFLQCNINDYLNTVFISKNNRRYFVNYSPMIELIDKNKFEVFKRQLIKWYNATLNNMYDYDMFMI